MLSVCCGLCWRWNHVDVERRERLSLVDRVLAGGCVDIVAIFANMRQVIVEG